MNKNIKDALAGKKCIRLMEAHSPLCGRLIEQAWINRDDIIHRFDGLWLSSLSDSTIRVKPDIELLSIEARLSMLHDLQEACSLPIVYDADSGGKVDHLPFYVRRLEKSGISMIIIEDKEGDKRNSLLDVGGYQPQASIPDFCRKLEVAQSARNSPDFMIVARIESLIQGKGIDDAIERAKCYHDTGADGIMIHSKRKEADEILRFCQIYREHDKLTPIIVCPTTYNSTREDVLEDAGANVIIYANHLLRASHLAISRALTSILENGRSLEAEINCTDLQRILNISS